MRKVFILLSCLAFFSACKKNNLGGDLSGDSYIKGRLFLSDPSSSNIYATPLPKKAIFISYAGTADTINYLFSDTTDANGYFLFQNLTNNKKYRLFYQDTIKGLIYAAIDSSIAPKDTLALIARLSTTAQNGVWASIEDPTGGAINNANLFLFQSPIFGYRNNTEDGSNYQTTSDPAGHAFKLNITPATYYLLATISLNGVSYIAKDTINIGDRVVFDTLVLSPVNGIKFTTVDTAGAILPATNICIFTSAILYQQGTCSGSNYQIVSDATGNVAKYNLAVGIYYIYSSLVAGQDTLVGNNQILLGNTVVNDTLILKKK